MEEMNFQWVLPLLASSQATLPMLDCYYIKNDSPVFLYRINHQSKITASPEPSTIADLLAKIYREIILLQKLGMTSQLACYFQIKEKRHKISVQDLEMIIATGSIPSHIKLIQVPKPNMIDGMLVYGLTYDVSTKSKSLYFVQNEAKHKVNEPSVMQSSLAIVKKLIKIIEKVKKVKTMYIEFVADTEGQLWIIDIKHISTQLPKSVSFKLHKASGYKLNGYHAQGKINKTRELGEDSPIFGKKLSKKNTINHSLSHAKLDSAKTKKRLNENSDIITQRSKGQLAKSKVQKSKKSKKTLHSKSKSKLSNCADLSNSRCLNSFNKCI